MSRPLILAGMLGAAVGVPYAVTNAPQGWPGKASAPASPSGEANAPPISQIQSPGSHLYNSSAPIEGAHYKSLEQVLRWDVSKEWVYRHWARKSAGLAEVDLFGVRVPLVSGGGMDDVAGSLSYYFDAAGQLQQIQLYGRTADTRRLTRIAQSRFGMRRKRAPAGEQLYQRDSGGKILSELRTSPKGVLWSTTPHQSFMVDLEVNRLGAGRFVERPLPKLNIPKVASQPAPMPTNQPDTPPEQAAQADQAEVKKDIKPARRPDFRWPN